MARKRISKTSHGFARNFTDASQEVFQPVQGAFKAIRWVAPVCVAAGIEEAEV